MNGGGNYEWTLGESTLDGVRTYGDTRRWNGYARLLLGPPVLNGSLQYERGEEGSSTRSLFITTRSPTLVRETWAATASWRPAELPTLDLRASRAHQYDRERALADLTTDELLAATRYQPTRTVDVTYSLRYSNPRDALNDVDTRDLSNAGQVIWSDRLLDRRLTTYVSYGLGNRRTETIAPGQNGTVSVAVLPTLGLSAIEAFPSTPEKVKLAPNGTLVDGDTTTVAGIGPADRIDLGFGPATRGDVALRDLGAQFGGGVSPVNTIYVWVDHELPPEVSAAIPFTAYRSDDNETWSQVPITGPVRFGPFQNRFQIPIERTEARYLKVVTRPLSPAVTTSPAHAAILVTELQFALTLPADQVRGTTTQTSGTLNAVLRYQITRRWNVAYDTAFFLAHASRAPTIWNVVNGLSASERLTPVLGASGRVDRTDSRTNRGHEATSRLSGGLSADPLPTLGGALTYSGQVRETADGTGYFNGLGAFARAALYEGIDLSTSASFNLGRNEFGQSTRSTAVTAGTTLVPNRSASVNANYTYAQSSATGGGRPDVSDSASRVDASATYTPFPALVTSGGVSRFLTGKTPSTLANFAVSFSPFQGGDLLFRFGYSDTLDTGADLRTRIWGPGVRWNIRRGLAYLDVAYTVLANRTPTVDTDSRTLLATLAITLR